MLLRTRGEESEARFNRSMAWLRRREPLTDRSATPQMANRLMKKSNSVDKGDDSFLFVKKMARGLSGRGAPRFSVRASVIRGRRPSHQETPVNPLVHRLPEKHVARKPLL